MKFIINIILIIFVFTACNKKEIVIYKQDKVINVDNSKDNIPINNNDDVINNNYKAHNKIAIIYSSSKIGKYSIKISDIILAYTSRNNNNFSYDFYDINDESQTSISNIFARLSNEDIKDVMMFITEPNLNNLLIYDNIKDFNIYLPLINKKVYDIDNNTNIIFGGINYKDQLNELKNISNSNIIEIYDNKYRNIKLHNIIKDDNEITSYILNGKYPNYKEFIKRHNSLNNASIILNLDVVKSAIFLSQIRAIDDLNVSQVLTTQNNFTPLLFVLSQKKDTTNLIIANSIQNIDTELYNTNKFIGNDIRYDWVNYSTILGLEYLRTKRKTLFNNVEIINNQVKYPVKLFSVKNNSFISYVKE